MRHARRAILLLAVAAAPACRRTPADCPDGLSVVPGKTRTGAEIACKSADGTRGRWIELHPDGKGRRQVCAYANGRAQGSFTGWHPDGKPWIQGEYEGGLKVGRWVQWDRDGMKVAEGEYRNGTLVAGAPVGIAAKCEGKAP